MKKLKPSNEEFCLPKEMIQHIQSFLRVKVAARSSLVSKSWHNAWSTRRNLEFNVYEFSRNINLFWEFMEKTMQRYEEFNFMIESFTLYLSLSMRPCVFEEKSMKIVEESMVKAMKMGTIDFSFENKWTPITLPREVLGSETLIRLSLSGCKIEESKVSCFGLKSLSLSSVEMGSDTFRDIVSSCPLIEKLLVFFPYPRSLVTAMYLCKLKDLRLFSLDVDSSFFSDLSSKFPLLKELRLLYCGGFRGIEFCSPSLECISFIREDKLDHLLWVKCDVPNIRSFKFDYSAPNLPSLSFKTSSRKWESDIVLHCRDASAEWFLEVNKFLNGLSMSTISLTLSIVRFVAGDVDFQGFRTIAVENLDVNVMPCDASLIVKCLFYTCRPNFISQYYYPSLSGNMLLKILYKTLLKGARRRRVFSLQGLQKVNVELFEESVAKCWPFEESVAKWRPLPWRTLLRNSSKPKTKKSLRLQFRWRSELSDANMT